MLITFEKNIFKNIVKVQEFVLYLYYQIKTNMEITKFKSIRPINVKHERGEDFIQTEGQVIKIENGRVYLKGIFYDFNISLSDFQNRNIHTK